MPIKFVALEQFCQILQAFHLYSTIIVHVRNVIVPFSNKSH